MSFSWGSGADWLDETDLELGLWTDSWAESDFGEDSHAEAVTECWSGVGVNVCVAHTHRIAVATIVSATHSRDSGVKAFSAEGLGMAVILVEGSGIAAIF